jgi:GR25 family glycosyltransferase involved in LPS biosynthesis
MGNGLPTPQHTHPNWTDLPVYVINLRKRPDRWRTLSRELRTQLGPGLQLRQFEATPATPGHRGCCTSHLRVFREARARDLPWVLVLEDDFMLTQPASYGLAMIQKWWYDHPDSQVLMLQVNPFQLTPTATPHLSQVHSAFCAAAYVVRRTYYATLIASLEKSLREGQPCDVGYLELQKRDQWHVTQPPLGQQRPGWSDIEQCQVNYGL